MSEPSPVVLRFLSVFCLCTVLAVALLGGIVPGTAVSTGELVDSSGVSDDAVLATDAGATDATFNGSTAIESNTTFVIEIQTNGDAHWTVTERFNVSTQHQRQIFEDLASEFESGSGEGANLGYDSFERAGELVDEETERDVAVTGEERTSTTEGDVGELALSFTWENFARDDGNQIRIDDVFETEHGLWFQGLTRNQELVIRSPDGFGFDDANVLPDGGQLHWEGPASFSNRTLQAVLVGNGGGGPSTPTPTPGPAPPGGNSIGLGMVALALGGMGALGAVVAVAVMVVGTDRLQAALTQLGTGTDEPSTVDPDAQTHPPDESPESTDSEDDVDLELLSDEERVERLLERNGGRMKQATIVKETGWSNAKVSQLLSSMEEGDSINKLRIGRENLISFPDEDITEIGDK